MPTYQRVTFKPEGAKRARTIYLCDPMQTGDLLTGIEVDAEGDEIHGRGFDERRHVISLGLVTRRVDMRMDNIYGTLTEASNG